MDKEKKEKKDKKKKGGEVEVAEEDWHAPIVVTLPPLVEEKLGTMRVKVQVIPKTQTGKQAFLEKSVFRLHDEERIRRERIQLLRMQQNAHVARMASPVHDEHKRYVFTFTSAPKAASKKLRGKERNSWIPKDPPAPRHEAALRRAQLAKGDMEKIFSRVYSPPSRVMQLGAPLDEEEEERSNISEEYRGYEFIPADGPDEAAGSRRGSGTQLRSSSEPAGAKPGATSAAQQSRRYGVFQGYRERRPSTGSNAGDRRPSTARAKGGARTSRSNPSTPGTPMSSSALSATMKARSKEAKSQGQLTRSKSIAVPRVEFDESVTNGPRPSISASRPRARNSMPSPTSPSFAEMNQNNAGDVSRAEFLTAFKANVMQEAAAPATEAQADLQADVPPGTAAEVQQQEAAPDMQADVQANAKGEVSSVDATNTETETEDDKKGKKDKKDKKEKKKKGKFW
mmetsp:Transcript_28862/g.52997  ORF Transcript_28862/g.52997 Transcript_28862/m.52997 type:complete len:454 (-) Transcript_28862:119-1480(-)